MKCDRCALTPNNCGYYDIKKEGCPKVSLCLWHILQNSGANNAISEEINNKDLDTVRGDNEDKTTIK